MSASVIGVEGQFIEVEVHISHGLPQVAIVGLPDSAVRESVERVRAAIQNGGMKFPLDRITINLAPADQRKAGSAFDLAIAVGILCASKQVSPALLENTLFIGELSLDGAVRHVPGVLPMSELACRAGVRKMVVPLSAVTEASLIAGIEVLGISSLAEWVNGVGEGAPSGSRSSSVAAGFRSQGLQRSYSAEADAVREEDELDLSDVAGQSQGKRALLIAASGMHNLLFVGPPGTGKTMLCRRLPTLLPPLDDEEALAVTKIYSVCGKLGAAHAGLIRRRSFRAPHHTISIGGLIGGGASPKPGEVTLAHHGILFLDELPEFSRANLEALRQPLEDREVTIGRTHGVCRFPARFMLAAAMNPCLCGYHIGDADRICLCSPAAIMRYRARISGPLADRLDLQVELPRQSTLIPGEGKGLSSAQAREIVSGAARRQQRRYARHGFRWNSQLQGALLKRYARLSPDAEALLQQVYSQLGLSHRAHDRILKISRTIADLADRENILAEDVAEASSYRCLDQKL